MRERHGILAVRLSRPALHYRRSPFVVCYWSGPKLLVYNYATGANTAVAPTLLDVLHACDTWRTVDQVRSALEISRLRAETSLRVLAAYGLLQRSDVPEDPRDRTMSAIAEWNPAAGFFHAATRHVRFLAPAAASRLIRQRATARPMPPPVKRLRGARSVRLPKPAISGEFPGVLTARRTWRRFGSAPVSLSDLASALALTAGVQRWLTTPFGRVPLKTSPSGGARHPIELYVCVRNVAGLRAGLYHYAADVHRLEEIQRGNLVDRLRVWMPRSQYFAKAAFVVVLTAVLDRQVWRYPYARAYRAALAEAGHVCQTFCLTATWLGLAPFCLMGLDDAEIEKDLGVDGVSETVLYVAGAGSRPRGMTWAPRPRGTAHAIPNPPFGQR
jgi:SagB-type dehydrogenase family enzyme